MRLQEALWCNVRPLRAFQRGAGSQPPLITLWGGELAGKAPDSKGSLGAFMHVVCIFGTFMHMDMCSLLFGRIKFQNLK